LELARSIFSELKRLKMLEYFYHVSQYHNLSLLLYRKIVKKSTILNGFSKIFLSKEKADGDGRVPSPSA